MSRIVMTWELGANYGHLARLAPIAVKLRSLGHEVIFIVRDTGSAATVLSPLGFTFIQAPFWHGGACLKSPPVNYAELLIAEGYLHVASLAGMVAAWLTTFRLTAADLVVIDHSPTALLAARSVNLPVVMINNGFGIPPDVAPLPSIRPWESVSEQRLYAAESRVIRSVNTISHALGGASYTRLAALFVVDSVVLATFPELDHYGVRSDSVYAGPLFSDVGLQNVAWQAEGKHKLFAYLRPQMLGLRAVMETLGQWDGEVVCVLPGLGERRPALCGDMRLYSHPLRLSELLPEADLVVSYAGAGMIGTSLLAGVPLLLIPQNVEQYLLGRRVVELGAGLALGIDRSGSAMRTALDTLMEESRFKNHAQQFAAAHIGYMPDQAVATVVQAISTVLSQAGRLNGSAQW